jgi:hypothetical protein
MVKVLAAIGLCGALIATLTAFYGFEDASVAFNTVIRGMTVMLIGSTLFGIGRPITQGQRVGMAMMGSGMIMTATTFVDNHSPFQSWAFLLAGGGLLVYLLDTYGSGLWQHVAGRK